MRIKKIFRFMLCMILSATMLSTAGLLYATGEGTHGLYMECSASVTNNRSNGFMIDFFSDSDDALCTYWSNANWNMDTKATMRQLGYRDMSGGGAYAGLQIRGSKNDHVGIMSMWLWDYVDKKDGGKAKQLYAESMMSKTSRYDNEGSGTSCIQPYDWKNGQWYRQLLFCWDDEETGYTMIGTWFYDYEADVWTLFTYYNTGLVGSFINTGCDQFLENYSDYYNNRFRSWRYRNVYFLSHDTGEWVSQPNVTMHTDGNVKAVGVCEMGISDDGTYVWGTADGSGGKNVADPNWKEQKMYFTLKQDATPSYGTPAVKSFNAEDLTKISWELDEHSTPQLSYSVVVRDKLGREIGSVFGTRPQIVEASLQNIRNVDYEATLTIRDVFGQETSTVFKTEGYDTPYNPAEEIYKLPFRVGALTVALTVDPTVNGITGTKENG